MAGKLTMIPLRENSYFVDLPASAIPKIRASSSQLWTAGVKCWGSGFDGKPNERFGTLNIGNLQVVEGQLLLLWTEKYGIQKFRSAEIRELPSE